MKSRTEPDFGERYISASEISEYVFCNVSWYLDKTGSQRNHGSSRRMKQGIKSHSSLRKRYRATKAATYLSVILLIAIAAYLFITVY